MAENEKKGFLLYTENAKQFNMLSDEQAGKLIKTIFYYAENRDAENRSAPAFDDGMVELAFSFIKDKIDDAAEKWEKTKNQRSKSGKTGAEKRWKNSSAISDMANDSSAINDDGKNSNAISDMAKMAVTVTGTVTDTVTVTGDNIPPKSPKGEKGVNGSGKKTAKAKADEEAEQKAYATGFGRFWEAYPEDRQLAKANAIKKWNELEPDDQLVRIILRALEEHKKTPQWLREDGRFIPYPATWLKDRRWEDELNGGDNHAGQPKQNAGYGGFVPSEGFRK